MEGRSEMRTGRVVLVVDDEEGIRRVVASVLELSGYRVLLASNAHDALRIASQEAVDLVLTDISMPTMSGLELGAILASEQPALPVVYMSGALGRELRGDPSQIAHFVQKPFNVKTLARSIELALFPGHGVPRVGFMVSRAGNV